MREYYVNAGTRGGSTWPCTVAGPFRSRSTAEAAMVSAVERGYGDVRLKVTEVEDEDEDKQTDEESA